MDIRQLDWHRESKVFYHGVQKYYRHEDVESPESNFKQIVKFNRTGPGYDLKFSMNNYPDLIEHQLSDIFPGVLDSKAYEKYINLTIPKDKLDSMVKGVSGSVIGLDQQDAIAQLNQLDCRLSKKALRPMFAFFNRQFRHALEGLFVDQMGIKNIKQLLDKGERVLLLPTYKSFTDLFFMLYILFVNKIELPFSVGTFNDTPRTKVIDQLIKQCGYIIA